MPGNPPTAKASPNNYIPIAIIDTNILMKDPRIFDCDWGEKDIHIYILNTVVDELFGLSRDRLNPEKARSAQRARDILDNLQKKSTGQGLPFQGGRIRLFFTPPPEKIIPPLSPDNVDHQQIAFAQECIRKRPNRFCAIITMDREMSEHASAANPVVQIIQPNRTNFEASLIERFWKRHDYYIKWRNDGGSPEESPGDEIPHLAGESIKPPRTSKRRRLNSEERLSRIVQNFYSRVRASRHRAILSISPLKARIALTSHILSVLRLAPNRVILLYVDTASAAEFWAAELRVLCKLPPKAVHVFHDHGLPVGEDSKVIIYRHDQIESRFRHHVARFEEANRLVTIIVDGCDLLSPEQLALLLFEKHQFIGYTRHILNHTHTPGGRMLAHFFEQQSILSYTFVDAEEDGWLRSFDLIRQPVSWCPDELKEYRQANNEFIEEHNHVLKAYPFLARSPDFWDGLQELLETVADARTANLFQLRERREEMAQIAMNKLAIMSHLVSSEDGEKKHQIIFDPCGLWASVLERKFTESGKKAEFISGAIAQEEWDRVWQRFIHNQIEILVLTEVPPLGLCRSDIQRLIVTTPIAALSNLAAMMDWVLSHTHPESKNPTEIHILHVLDTPEEPAMLDFADSVCGVHFNYTQMGEIGNTIQPPLGRLPSR